MCDQTQIEYKNGDIVWVKLGSCWWPGEVHDLKNIDEETVAGLKKPIIAAVKFFDEDCYEFIKNIDRIYSYNCTKKNEFIKKGLDLHRAKHEYMKKFPADIAKAEERTNGDPKIIDDPIFAPEKKTNVAALLFGSPKPKKSPKKSSGSEKKDAGSRSSTSSSKSPKGRVITHPRFLGFDDHKVRILVQTSEQVEPPEEEPAEKAMYKCAACGFSTERVDVSIMHHKSHIQGLFPSPVPMSKSKKRPQTKRPKKSKMAKSKTASIMEDLQLIEKGLFFRSESSEDNSIEEENTPKRKRKKVKRKTSKGAVPEKTGALIDIRGDLLAEWDEEDSDAEVDTLLNMSQPVTDLEQSIEVVKEPKVIKEKSCFDFNEDDEDEIVSASGGRKIPRVIPPPDRPKSIELENLDQLSTSSPPNGLEEVDVNRESPVENTNTCNLEVPIDSTLDRSEILKIIHQVDESSGDTFPVQLVKDNEDLLEKDKIEDLDLAFKDILEATSVPELPEIPHSLNFEPTVKKPPVSDAKPTDAEMAAKLINPKKRFVKSFEDFEQQIHNEQKKLQLEQAVAAIKEKNQETQEPVKIEATVQVAKLKTQLKNKLDNTEYVDESKPKRPRLLRDRILSSHREELEELQKEVPKEYDLIDSHSNYSSVISLPRATSTVPDDLLESSYCIASDEKDSAQSEENVNDTDSVQIEIITEPPVEVECSKPRRLSIKMSEINETPFETTESLEVEAEETLNLKPTQVYNSTEIVNVLEVAPLIETETVNAINASTVATVNEVENKTLDNTDQPEPVAEVSEEHQIVKEVTGDTVPDVFEEPKENIHIPKVEETILETEEISLEAEELVTMDIVEDAVTSEEQSISSTHEESVMVDTTIAPADTFINVTSDSQAMVEDLSALTTLATVSELTTNLDISSALVNEKTKMIEENLSSIDKSNLNFVTMDDLAEGQVEISDVCISKVKANPMSLMNFSVDFGDSNEASYISPQPLSSEKVASPASNVSEEEMHQPDSIEMSLGKVFEGESEALTGASESVELKGEDKEQTNTSLLTSNGKHFLKKMKKSLGEKFKPPEYSSSSKLLEILTDPKPKSLHSDVEQSKTVAVETPINKAFSKPKSEKFFAMKESVPFGKHLLKSKESPKEPSKILPKLKEEKYTISKDSLSLVKNVSGKSSKFILKPTSVKSYTANKSNKPVILSEKIIKRMPESQDGVSVRKVTSNNALDFEDIDAYIIHKPFKKVKKEEDDLELPVIKKSLPVKGKAKILQQTIIKPATTEVQQAPAVDDGMFDINSMPIVLGDQILTTEGIEKMPVVEQEVVSTPTSTKTIEQQVLLSSNKTVTSQPLILKTYSSQKLSKSSPRVYQTTPSAAAKILKTNPTIISRPGKQDKYIILPSGTSTGSKYTVGKRQSIPRVTPVILPTPSPTPKLQAASEPSGNKIMIVTNQQGQQSRVLLTPAQQKLFGYQTSSSKLVKSTIKGNILQKTTRTSPLPKIASEPQTVINTEPVLVSMKGTPLRPVKTEVAKSNRKFQIPQHKVGIPGQKMIIIKNQEGQVVKRFQGTDDALLEQQVAEQVQAIKANTGNFTPLNLTAKVKAPLKRTYIKKPEIQKSMKVATKIIKNESVPPLAPISPKRSESLLLAHKSEPKVETGQQKPLNQLIIQDALGNQTTIMEGQILALPSGETVDGQPQSYMLVTLDESGNLAPLNNEALLSLDPNLTLGGDLSNMVLQLDDGTVKKGVPKPDPIEAPIEVPKPEPVIEPPMKAETETQPPPVDSQANVQTVTCSINNDPNKQLIITGDPISTQKFIESLTEGNADLANLLASAEGNILIQADEQQILINTDSENQVLLPFGSEKIESSESDSNPIFATQPVKNQDILAAALADTDVFQPEQAISPIHNKLVQSQLSPTGGLYPTGVANVLETTLSLSSPIMTPLEVPSTNNKKIPDEEMDILTTEVPKNVDLPITITDPNISQTVAQQQVVSLMSNELELPLTLADTVVAPATELHSPSYGFPLTSLDDSVTEQKSFSAPISMPLLTEDDPQDSTISEVTVESGEIIEEGCENVEESIIQRVPLFESTPLTDSIMKDEHKSVPTRTFLRTPIASEEGLCTLGGAMCSSLSEPPPDMFDLSMIAPHFATSTAVSKSPESSENSQEYENYKESKVESEILRSPAELPIDENSCEIPVQPQIVTDLSQSNFESTKRDDDDESNDKNFD